MGRQRERMEEVVQDQCNVRGNSIQWRMEKKMRKNGEKERKGGRDGWM